ncbi:unnamed protein product [Phaeothamnion confervicola]
MAREVRMLFLYVARPSRNSHLTPSKQQKGDGDAAWRKPSREAVPSRCQHIRRTRADGSPLLAAAAWLALLLALCLQPAGAHALESDIAAANAATVAAFAAAAATANARAAPPAPPSPRQLQGKNEPNALRFYMYEGPAWTCSTPREKDPLPTAGEDYYLATQIFWQRDLANHPWRTRDGNQAQLFVVPCDLDRSYYAGDVDGQTHMDRVGKALDALDASLWYQRRNGLDHFWVIMRWEMENKDFRQVFFPTERLPLIKNMVVGRYWDAPDERTAYGLYTNYGPLDRAWRCTVTVPILTPPKFWREERYNEWKARPITFYFRGKGRNCFMERSQLNRNLTMEIVGSVPPSLINNDHAESPEAYRQEIMQAKYCLVFACDDPQTSRFYDAVAAGCIPVIINDHFRWIVHALPARPAVAPFTRVLDYDSFTVTISEVDWVQDPSIAAQWVLARGEILKQRMHANLMRMRRAIMWRHPQSHVATMGLRTVVQECLKPPSYYHAALHQRTGAENGERSRGDYPGEGSSGDDGGGGGGSAFGAVVGGPRRRRVGQHHGRGRFAGHNGLFSFGEVAF